MTFSLNLHTASSSIKLSTFASSSAPIFSSNLAPSAAVVGVGGMEDAVDSAAGNEQCEEKEAPTCCWGIFRTHVEQGARIIACVGILFNVLGALAFFVPSSEVHDPWMGVAALLYVLPCVGVIVALRRRDPRFYLPYLIFGVAEILFYVADMVVCFLFVFMPPDANVQQFLKDHPEVYGGIDQASKGYKVSQAVEALTLLANVVVAIWFYSVVWAAFKLMRQQHSHGRMRLSELSA